MEISKVDFVQVLKGIQNFISFSHYNLALFQELVKAKYELPNSITLSTEKHRLAISPKRWIEINSTMEGRENFTDEIRPYIADYVSRTYDILKRYCNHTKINFPNNLLKLHCRINHKYHNTLLLLLVLRNSVTHIDLYEVDWPANTPNQFTWNGNIFSKGMKTEELALFEGEMLKLIEEAIEFLENELD